MAGKGCFLGKPSCYWEVTYLGEAGAWESSGAEPGGASCVGNTDSEEMQPLTSSALWGHHRGVLRCSGAVLRAVLRTERPISA